MRFFSTKNRPAHLGPYPLEDLARLSSVPDFSNVQTMSRVEFARPDNPQSIVNAMGEYQAMMDAIRDGLVNKAQSKVPADLNERANHLKGFGYFSDASMVGICKLPKAAMLSVPIRNPDIDRLALELKTKQTKTLAAGIDLIMADLKESMQAPPSTIDQHSHAIVFLYEYHRDPDENETGAEWIGDAQAQRACLRATETACVLGNYLRVLGFDARTHSSATSDVDLNILAVASGLAHMRDGELRNPFLGTRFGLAAITTTFEMTCDVPLAEQQNITKTFGWKLGTKTFKSALNRDPYAKREYVNGAHPFEKLKRVDDPTTFIDEARVARVPKRADMFARAQFGDMGKTVQKGATAGYYVRKAAPSTAQRRALGAFVLLQDGPWEKETSASTRDAKRNAENIKAACYFLGVDAVGLSRCPDWTWYSHDARGDEINPPHDQAISMIIDQGYETMEGASGDDWISVAQSMRAYLRFSLLGGVIAKHIRNLGYSAKAHSVLDGEVLQPPLLLLSGLGEVSRIGEVILNPYLGPRLKSGVVTTTMPMTHDKPIDFGLQKFCESCQKCARECPSGAITAGPKRMFNGYEIWKSDSQKCATYRITTEGGAMCGRCMKTCPWNLEGIFSDSPVRWAAMNIPTAAPLLAKLDDMVGNGDLNLIKKWWWDLEVNDEGGYQQTEKPLNERGLQKDLKLDHADQTLAVYPANLAPPPYPFPFPMDREKGIEAYQNMISADDYQARLAKGDDAPTEHIYQPVRGEAPVIQAVVSRAKKMTNDVTLYEFKSVDGSDLPNWQAGAHLDVVVAPEFLRQYSMSGNPADRSIYQIAVLREDQGKGGSRLMHRIFEEGRRVFISRPINHFPLDASAAKTLLLGGGIGITPMIAMAHELHSKDADFEFHYSSRSRETAGFLDELSDMPWKKNIHLHFSNEGTRLDLMVTLRSPMPDLHLYTCGPDRFMNAIIETAQQAGWNDDQVHREYFSVPDAPEYENHDFILRLKKSGHDIKILAEESPTDVLAKHGVHVDVKCSDGLCGVCKCGLISGEVEHRDFVLSQAQRENSIILCQSRAAKPGGIVEVDL